MGRQQPHAPLPRYPLLTSGRVLRRGVNGILWVLRLGGTWRMPCYNRFLRWRRADVLGRVKDALAVGPSCAYFSTKPASRTMVTRTSVVREGLMSEFHVVIDSNGPPVPRPRWGCRQTIMPDEMKVVVPSNPLMDTAWTILWAGKVFGDGTTFRARGR